MRRSEATVPSERHVRMLVAWILLLAVANLALLSIAVWPTPSEWDPIEPFEQQVVLNTGPIHYDDQIVVEGEKCYKEDVEVAGERYWNTEKPPGAIVPDGAGVAHRSRGCVQFRGADAFQNEVPQSVIELDQEMKGRGRDPSWYISGTERPFDAEGNEGVNRTWRTESFTLTPEP